MTRSKFTDEQILVFVREGEGGRPMADMCRARGITGEDLLPWEVEAWRARGERDALLGASNSSATSRAAATPKRFDGPTH
jgi:Transposase